MKTDFECDGCGHIFPVDELERVDDDPFSDNYMCKTCVESKAISSVHE